MAVNGAKHSNGANSPRQKSWRAGFGVPEVDDDAVRAKAVTFGKADDEDSVSDEAAGLVSPNTKQSGIQKRGATTQYAGNDKRSEYEAAGLVPPKAPEFNISRVHIAFGVAVVALLSIMGCAFLVTAMGYELTGPEEDSRQTDLAEMERLRARLAKLQDRTAGEEEEEWGPEDGAGPNFEGNEPREAEAGLAGGGGGLEAAAAAPPVQDAAMSKARPSLAGLFRQENRAAEGEPGPEGGGQDPLGGVSEEDREAKRPAMTAEKEKRIAEFRRRSRDRLEEWRKANPERFERLKARYNRSAWTRQAWHRDRDFPLAGFQQRQSRGAERPPFEPAADPGIWQARGGGFQREGPDGPAAADPRTWRPRGEGGARPWGDDQDAPQRPFQGQTWQRHPNDDGPNLYNGGGNRLLTATAGECDLSSLSDCSGTVRMVPCPALRAPDRAAVLRRALVGERVHSTRRLQTVEVKKEPLHLFIMASAKTGATALAGLVLTSPAASGLCNEHLCEGVHALQRAGLFDRAKSWEDEVTIDWEAALSVWEKQWEPSKAVWVEKGQDWHMPNRIDELVSHLRSAGKRAGFLFLTRSACFGASEPPRGPSGGLPGGPRCRQDRNSLLSNAIEVVRRGSFPLHVVQYEEMIRDPYVVAQQVLDAFPSLGSLQPATSGLAANVRRFYGENSTVARLLQASLTDYVADLRDDLNGREFQRRTLPSVSERAARSSVCVGYQIDLD